MHRRLTLAVSVCLILSTKFGTTRGERWSRQVSNSEWIPLANPRSLQAQVEQTGPSTGRLASGSAQLPQLPQLSLPPALQQQYQEQLLQLQKTQENIQKLLLLQQQLRAQQQLLQVKYIFTFIHKLKLDYEATIGSLCFPSLKRSYQADSAMQATTRTSNCIKSDWETRRWRILLPKIWCHPSP